jgi:hypothetical protein
MNKIDLAVSILRDIEVAVVQDSAAELQGRSNVNRAVFNKAVRHRIANAVQIYCANEIVSVLTKPL